MYRYLGIIDEQSMDIRLFINNSKISQEYSCICFHSVASLFEHSLVITVIVFWSLLGHSLDIFNDHGESSGWLWGARGVSIGHIWKTKWYFWFVFWNFCGSNGIHLGAIFEHFSIYIFFHYLGTPATWHGEGFRSSHRCNVQPLLKTVSNPVTCNPGTALCPVL